MEPPPARGADTGKAAGTPPLAVNTASPDSNGASGGSGALDNGEMPQMEGGLQQQQLEVQEQASGRTSGATAEGRSAASSKRRVGQPRFRPASRRHDGMQSLLLGVRTQCTIREPSWCVDCSLLAACASPPWSPAPCAEQPRWSILPPDLPAHVPGLPEGADSI